MNSIVLDSSAVLAMVLGEPGGDRVLSAVATQSVPLALSAINWSEVLTRLQRSSPKVTGEMLAGMLPGVDVIPFGRFEAEQTAELAKTCAALSLGDRACLSLASARGAKAWTADRIWASMNAGVELEMLR